LVLGIPAPDFIALFESTCRKVARCPGVSDEDARDAVQEAIIACIGEWNVGEGAGGKAAGRSTRGCGACKGAEWIAAALWRRALNVAKAARRTEVRRSRLIRLRARSVEVAATAGPENMPRLATIRSLLSDTLAVHCTCARAVGERPVSAISIEIGRSRADVYRLIEEGKRELRQRAVCARLDQE
jgi:hypothetical protein